MRFFAAARAAVGVDEVELGDVELGDVELGDVSGDRSRTLGDALDGVAAADPERWRALRERCSYLVDGVTTRDRSTPLAGVTLVDVMPPFAGG
jgi:sulfur-carrier protein